MLVGIRIEAGNLLSDDWLVGEYVIQELLLDSEQQICQLFPVAFIFEQNLVVFVDFEVVLDFEDGLIKAIDVALLKFRV